MIVDDSAFIRGAMARAMEDAPYIQIVASVSNGELAVKSLRREPVDVIVLDIEMPVMDGLTALPQLKAIDPAVQIVMASTLTQRNAEISLKAMSLGATDYIPKPSTSRELMGAEEFKHELLEKIKALGALARRSGVRSSPFAAAARPVSPVPALIVTPVSKQDKPAQAPLSGVPVRMAGGAVKEIILRKEPIIRPDVIAIGSSTGGPQALFKVIKDMGAWLPQPVVITQHMPPAFTSILAEHIERQCQVKCTEAKDGEVLEPRHYYIAPGDFHMLINVRGGAPTISLVKDPPENFCRPAVDPMLRSLITVYGKRILVVILTGMGQDGTKGSDAVVKAGGSVIAQDEASSVVWGMPGAVATSGLCSAVLPITEIGGFVRHAVMEVRA
ncbi:MAG: chemotaxis response regulator protein-glutamate methylesterase [Alphaproteobacteria bacterium]|nr:chemotaxis response regulator protein-glutamate methylesterase [Alphaproteobacteria bacterium]